MSFNPPLAYGGHEFMSRDDLWVCWACGGRVPKADFEARSAHVGETCPNKAMRDTTKPKRPRPPRPPVIAGQLSIYDALEDQ